MLGAPLRMPLLPAGPVHVCDQTSDQIAENLAIDEALLDLAEEDGIAPALRFWENPAFAVVLGASSRLRDEVRLDTCHADSIPITRRTSGGGTVLIGPGALCVAVILPVATHPALAAVDTAQRHVLESAAAALNGLGASLAVRGHGDLTRDEKKICGSAQRRHRHHVLIHFSILCTFPLERISRYLAMPAREPAYRAGRSHADFVTNLERPTRIVSRCLLDAWSAGLDRIPATVPRSRIERILADKLHRNGWVERF